MKINEVRHPLIQHKLGLMRRAGISTKEFRELASEVAALLTYEATKDLETVEEQIDGWAGPLQVHRIKGKKITIVPILRAGLGMLPGVLDMIPSAKVSVVGVQRDVGATGHAVTVDLDHRRLVRMQQAGEAADEAAHHLIVDHRIPRLIR